MVISEWPGMQNTTSDKVPTEIYYDSSAPGGFRWGFDIESDVQRHQWFKLYVLYELQETIIVSTPLGFWLWYN